MDIICHISIINYFKLPYYESQFAEHFAQALEITQYLIKVEELWTKISVNLPKNI